MENKIKELEEKLFLKEQECEELKQKLHQCWTVENSFVEQLDQLEAENKKLKTDLKSLEYTIVSQSNRDIDNAVDLFAKRIAKIENENSILKAENKKLKQTLTEIKEIARWHTTSTDSEDIQDDVKQILQLISEVEL